MELAIDTSTGQASLALSHQGEAFAEVLWNAGHNHTVELIPHLIQMIEQHEVDIRQIEALTVAKGPGSFNGLRVGLSTAKGLSFALGIPLVSISTLEAIAYAYEDLALPIRPILQAGRGEIATAVFQRLDSDWTKSVAEHVTTIADLCVSIKKQTLFCGEMNSEQKMVLQDKLGDLAMITDVSDIRSRATYLAKLGWCRIDIGDFDDHSTLQPLYLKKPSITKPKRRKHDAMSNMRA